MKLLSRLARRLPLRLHPVLETSARQVISYSQQGEDIWLFNNILNQRVRDAVIFEVGALDGVTYSNSLLLERWTGTPSVLIEPSLMNFVACRQNRPTSRVYNLAAVRDFGIQTLIGDSALAALQGSMPRGYKDFWRIGDDSGARVLGVPLSSIMRIERCPWVDILSIDVQGGELEVLQGMSWEIPVGCVCIELDGMDVSRDEACRDLMTSVGLEFRERLGVSEMWVRPRYPRRSHLFAARDRRAPMKFLAPYMAGHLERTLLATLTASS